MKSQCNVPSPLVCSSSTNQTHNVSLPNQTPRGTASKTHHIADGVVDQNIEMVARDGPNNGVAAAADRCNCILSRAVFENDLKTWGVC